MKTQFEQMMDGLNDVEAFLAGEQEGFKAHVPQRVDVKAIRNRLGMTQARFQHVRVQPGRYQALGGRAEKPRSAGSHFAHYHRQESRCRAHRTESRRVRCRCWLF